MANRRSWCAAPDMTAGDWDGPDDAVEPARQEDGDMAAWLRSLRIPFDLADDYARALAAMGFDDVASLVNDCAEGELESAGLKPGHARRVARALQELHPGGALGLSFLNGGGNGNGTDGSTVRCRSCTVMCVDEDGRERSLFFQPDGAGAGGLRITLMPPAPSGPSSLLPPPPHGQSVPSTPPAATTLRRGGPLSLPLSRAESFDDSVAAATTVAAIPAAAAPGRGGVAADLFASASAAAANGGGGGVSGGGNCSCSGGDPLNWDVFAVAAWLAGFEVIGVPAYVDAFVAAGVDGRSLLGVTSEADAEDLGIVSRPHKLLLLREVAELRQRRARDLGLSATRDHLCISSSHLSGSLLAQSEGGLCGIGDGGSFGGIRGNAGGGGTGGVPGYGNGAVFVGAFGGVSGGRGGSGNGGVGGGGEGAEERGDDVGRSGAAGRVRGGGRGGEGGGSSAGPDRGDGGGGTVLCDVLMTGGEATIDGLGSLEIASSVETDVEADVDIRGEPDAAAAAAAGVIPAAVAVPPRGGAASDIPSASSAATERGLLLALPDGDIDSGGSAAGGVGGGGIGGGESGLPPRRITNLMIDLDMDGRPVAPAAGSGGGTESAAGGGGLDGLPTTGGGSSGRRLASGDSAAGSAGLVGLGSLGSGEGIGGGGGAAGGAWLEPAAPARSTTTAASVGAPREAPLSHSSLGDSIDEELEGGNDWARSPPRSGGGEGERGRRQSWGGESSPRDMVPDVLISPFGKMGVARSRGASGGSGGGGGGTGSGIARTRLRQAYEAPAPVTPKTRQHHAVRSSHHHQDGRNVGKSVSAAQVGRGGGGGGGGCNGGSTGAGRSSFKAEAAERKSVDSEAWRQRPDDGAHPPRRSNSGSGVGGWTSGDTAEGHVGGDHGSGGVGSSSTARFARRARALSTTSAGAGFDGLEVETTPKVNPLQHHLHLPAAATAPAARALSPRASRDADPFAVASSGPSGPKRASPSSAARSGSTAGAAAATIAAAAGDTTDVAERPKGRRGGLLVREHDESLRSGGGCASTKTSHVRIVQRIRSAPANVFFDTSSEELERAPALPAPSSASAVKTGAAARSRGGSGRCGGGVAGSAVDGGVAGSAVDGEFGTPCGSGATSSANGNGGNGSRRNSGGGDDFKMQQGLTISAWGGAGGGELSVDPSHDQIGERNSANGTSGGGLGGGDASREGRGATAAAPATAPAVPAAAPTMGSGYHGALALDVSLRDGGELFDEKSYDFSDGGTLRMNGFTIRPNGMTAAPPERRPGIRGRVQAAANGNRSGAGFAAGNGYGNGGNDGDYGGNFGGVNGGGGGHDDLEGSISSRSSEPDTARTASTGGTRESASGGSRDPDMRPGSSEPTAASSAAATAGTAIGYGTAPASTVGAAAPSAASSSSAAAVAAAATTAAAGDWVANEAPTPPLGVPVPKRADLRLLANQMGLSSRVVWEAFARAALRAEEDWAHGRMLAGLVARGVTPTPRARKRIVGP
ncbi:unnamed protein product, partial [Phaeothamnion confervicola]